MSVFFAFYCTTLPKYLLCSYLAACICVLKLTDKCWVALMQTRLRHVLSVFSRSFHFRDHTMTDIIPLYKTMKKSTFSDSEEEVGLGVLAGIYYRCINLVVMDFLNPQF